MPIQDHMIYFVTVAHEAGDYTPERNVADMDRATTVRDIAEGQFEGLSQVIEFNPHEATSRDVTEDVVHEVTDIWAHSGEELSDWQVEFVEAHLGVSAANLFRRAA